jgi:hypothetical protein
VAHPTYECKLLAIDSMLTLDDELDKCESISLYFLPEMVAVDLRDIDPLFREGFIESIAPSEYWNIIMIVCHKYEKIRYKILRYNNS